jgi:glycosyltransferase involved in cell wall biosynthesis
MKRILLLGNDPGDQQWSMLDCGEALLRGLRETNPSLSVHLISPDTSRLNWVRKKKLGRGFAIYYSRYISYPNLLRKLPPADIYHLIDHGNGWLVHQLDAHKTVVYCHDLIPLLLRKQLGSLVPWFSEFAFDQALNGLRKAARILCSCSQAKKDLVQYLGYPAEKITVIPLGIDPLLRPAKSSEEILSVRKEFRLPTDRKLILRVGQNVIYKNIEGALRIFRSLLDKMPDVFFVQAGGRLNANQLYLAKKLKVTSRIIDLGFLSREQLRRLYRAADLLIHPSIYDGLGLPPLEAMASGIPVIVSNRSSLPETVGNAGLVADPDFPDLFSIKIQEIFRDDKKCEELISKGLIRAGEFSWRKTCEKIIQAYNQLA